jgi:hypothetical protein
MSGKPEKENQIRGAIQAIDFILDIPETARKWQTDQKR